MTTSDSRLRIIIEALNQASTELNAVKKELEGVDKRAKEADPSLGKVNDLFKSITGVGLGSAISIGAVSLAVRESIDAAQTYSNQLLDLKRMSGDTATNMSYLAQAGDDVRLSQESIYQAMRYAREKGFVPTLENIKDLADKYQDLDSIEEKAALAAETFGMRAGPEMEKLLAIGREGIEKSSAAAEELGLVFSDTDLASIEEYRLAIDDLNDAIEGIKLNTGKVLIPLLTEAANVVSNEIGKVASANEVYEKRNELIKAGIIDNSEYYNLITRVANGTLSGADAMAILNQRQTDWEMENLTANERLRRHGQTLEEYRSSLKLAVDDTSNLKNELAGLNNIDLNLSGKITTELDKLARELAGGGKLDAANQAIWEGMMAGKITPEKGKEYLEALFVADQQMAVGLGKQTAAQAAKNIRDELGGSLTDAFAVLKDVDGYWANLKDKAITLSVNLDAAGIDPRILAYLLGNGVVEEPDNGRAVGGPVTAGGVYWVGEHGPEPFIPNSGGTIVPTEQAMGGGHIFYGPVTFQIDSGQTMEAVLSELAVKRG